MSDTSSTGPDASQMAKQAMGKASNAYNEAVSQAGPGMAAIALVLGSITWMVSSLFTFFDLSGGKFSEKFYVAFRNVSGTSILLLAAILIIKAVGGKMLMFSSKQLLSIVGLVGLIGGVVLTLCVIMGLAIDSSSGNALGSVLLGGGSTTFGRFLADIGQAAIALAVGLWGVAESRKA